MQCPKCNKKMKIMCRPDATILQDDSEFVEVLGRCEECEFVAYWEIVTYVDGRIEELNLRPYFFG